MGIDVLLHAWPGVLEEVPDALLVIIGDGSERAALQDMAAQRGLESSVRFLGRVDDTTLVACYQAADLSVVPTTSLEGFGLVVLESRACGTPAVVTDAGGLPEAVEGLDPATVVPAGDVTALADGLVRCLTDPAETPSAQQCRAHAEGHGWDEVARRHIDIYAGVADGSLPDRRPARIRVVYLDHCARLSGGELALLTLLPELDEVDAHVILAEDGPLVARLERNGVSVEILAMANSARLLSRHRVSPGALPFGTLTSTTAYVLRLAKRLRRLRPDVVHANSLKAAVYGGAAARLAGVPFLWHLHDRIAADYLPPAAVRLLRTLAARVPDSIVANSRATLATLGRAGRDGVVIANPVLPGPSSNVRPGDRRAAPLTVGMIGRLAPWKGQTVFLDAFATAFPDGPEQAVIVGAALFGEDDYEESLFKRAAALGLGNRVEFRGFREDVMGELAGMDIAVHASIVPEPFGRVVVEALAAGVAVIASDAGGPAEIITPGVDGLLTPPGDVDALAGSMRRLADDPDLRERLQDAGRRRAGDFAPASIAREFTAAYRELLRTRRTRS
jgi:glycosyltransferase involved in cell wall biosynthesis